jgi:uncharacterized membrane protein YdjX (TVP38/TMEM64 family)
MSSPKIKYQWKMPWRIVIVMALAIIILGGCFWGLMQINPTFFAIFSSQEQFKSYVDSFGQYGGLVYTLLQALQVVVAPIPGEFTGAIAGMLFGVPTGFIYASCGLALGSLIAFSLGRTFGQPIVNWMVPEADRHRFAAISSKKQLTLAFIIFLIPGLPKDSLTYLFSLGSIGYWEFFLVTQAARMPGTFLLVATGGAVADGNWVVVGTLAVVAVTCAGVVYWRKAQILAWLHK